MIANDMAYEDSLEFRLHALERLSVWHISADADALWIFILVMVAQPAGLAEAISKDVEFGAEGPELCEGNHEFDGMDKLQEDLATTEERLECPAETVSVSGLWIKLNQLNVLVKLNDMCCSDRHGSPIKLEHNMDTVTVFA